MTARALVTGADGYLGGVIADALAARDMAVTRVHRAPGPGADLVVDLAGPGALEQLAAVGEASLLVHCAAVFPPTVPEADCLEINPRITRTVAEWAARAGVRRVVHLSTTAVYGPHPSAISETHVPQPAGPYGRSKLASEQALDAAAGAHGFSVAHLRLSAPYGPLMRLTTVLKRFMLDAAAARALRVLGTGTRRQDFIYEGDIARAVECAAASTAAGAFNIASGMPVSMLDLARAVCRVHGRDPETFVVKGGDDPQEGARAEYSVARAREALGFVATVRLEDGLARCAAAWAPR